MNERNRGKLRMLTYINSGKLTDYLTPDEIWTLVDYHREKGADHASL